MKKIGPVRQFLLGFSLIFLLLLLAVSAVFYLAMKPRLDAEKLAKETAVSYAKLTETSSVDFYNGKETYYSVYGKTSSGAALIVAVDEDSDKCYSYAVSDGISSKAAKKLAKENGAESTEKVVFGIYDNQPIWEVRADKGYYLIHFETGELVKKEGV